MDARKGDRVILTRNWDHGFAGRIEKGTKGVIIEENSGVISGKSYKIKRVRRGCCNYRYDFR